MDLIIWHESWQLKHIKKWVKKGKKSPQCKNCTHSFSNSRVLRQLLYLRLVLISEFVGREEILLFGDKICLNYCRKHRKPIFGIQGEVKVVGIYSCHLLKKRWEIRKVSPIWTDKESYARKCSQSLLLDEHSQSNHSKLSLPCILEVYQLAQFQDFPEEWVSDSSYK